MAETRLKLGGMALRNGLFVHGPTHWAAAVRAADGTIQVASGAKRVRGAEGVARVPIARGVLRLGEMLAILPQVRRALPEARLAFETPSLIVTIAGTAALATGARRTRLSPASIEAVSSVLAMLPALVTLRSGSLARYHGAEHKTIGAYETGDDAAVMAKEHDRCGSHLVAPLLSTSLIGNVLAGRMKRGGPQQAARLGVSLAAAGVAVEVFGWMNRNAGNPVARALRLPGHALQTAIGTREPDAGELAVARAALDRLLALEG
jgi:uncharacterized protein YqhQ